MDGFVFGRSHAGVSDAAAIPAVFLNGLAKGGFSGLSLRAMPGLPGVRQSALLPPVAMLPVEVGSGLVRRVPVERFYIIICGLLLAVGGSLIWLGHI